MGLRFFKAFRDQVPELADDAVRAFKNSDQLVDDVNLPALSSGTAMTPKKPALVGEVLDAEMPLAPMGVSPSVADDIIDASVIPPKKGMSTLQKIALGGAGAGGLGIGLAALDQNEQPADRFPTGVTVTTPEPDDNVYQNFSGIGTLANPDVHKFERQELDPGNDVKKTSPVRAIAGDVKAAGPVETAPSPMEEGAGFTENTVENLRNAQKQAADGRLANELGRASELVGTAISGAKPIAQEIFTQQAKDSDNIVKSFEERAEKEKSDPKSAISHQFRDFVRKFGVTVPSNMSAEAAAKIMPYAYQKFAAKEAQEARAFEAGENRALRRDMAAESAAIRKDAAKIRDTDKQVSRASDKAVTLASKIQNDYYKNYNQVSDAARIIETNMKDPTPQGDLATVYSFVKVLDPGSVVKEGEIKLSQAARSIPTGMQGALNKYISGQTLTPKERKDIADLAGKAASRSRAVWDASAKPYIAQAEKLGLDKDLYLPPEALEPRTQAKTPASAEMPNKAAPSRTIVKKGYNSKTNQTQFVYSDGSKEIVEGRQ